MVSVAPGLCSFLGPPSEKRQTAGCRKEAHWNWKVAKLPIADSIAAREALPEWICGLDESLVAESRKQGATQIAFRSTPYSCSSSLCCSSAQVQWTSDHSYVFRCVLLLGIQGSSSNAVAKSAKLLHMLQQLA